MSRPIKLAALACSGALLVGVTACGGNSANDKTGATSTGSSQNDGGGDAKSLVSNSAMAIGDSKEATITVRFDTTKDDIKKIATIGSDTATPIDDKVAQFIADSSLSVAVRSQTALKDMKDPFGSDLSITHKSGDITNQIVLLAGLKSIYVKVPVLKQYELFTGKDMSGEMGSAPEWAKTMFNGDWVGMDIPEDTRNQILSGMKSAPTATSSAQTEALKTAFMNNATFTDQGDKDGGKAVRIDVKLKPMLEAAQKDGPTAAASLQESTDSIKDDAVLTLDTVVKDNTLASVRFDLTQVKGWVNEANLKSTSDKESFAKFKNLDFKAAVVMTYDKAANVDVPSGAKMVTMAELGQLFGGSL